MNQENKTTKKKSTTKIDNKKQNKTVSTKKTTKVNKTKKDNVVKNETKVTKEILDKPAKKQEVIQKELKKKNNFRTSEVVFLVISACVLSFAMAALIFCKGKVELTNTDNKVPDEFTKQYENIINNYYGEIDEKNIIDGAIKGMIQSLNDPYATYFNTNDAKNFNIQLDGEFEGIGVEILKTSDNKINVLSVFEDSPASKAGLKAGDIIINVDGQDASTMTTEEIAQIITKNKKINLVVNRSDKKLEFNIKTGKIYIKSVSSEVIEKENHKVGYIKIDIFALNTYEQFKKQLNELESKGIEALIIDLKDNSGGHLTSVDDILSLFLSKNKVMYQIKKASGIQKFYSKGKSDKKYPIAVLVNNASASGSEIVAAALKENLNAVIIGKTTYGKGTAQELITLSSGEQYKFTTKEWLTPNGNSINNNGIKPDVIVDDDLGINKAISKLINLR